MMKMRLQLMKVKEIRTASRKEPLVEGRNSLAAFINVEKGDRSLNLRRVLEAIMKKYARIGTDNIVLVPFAHLSNSLATGKEAKETLEQLRDLVLSQRVPVQLDVFGIDKSLDISVDCGDPICYMEFKPQKPRDAIELYDRYGVEYDEYMERNGHYETQRKLIGLLAEHIKGPTLDVACGSGVILEELNKLKEPLLNAALNSGSMLEQLINSGFFGLFELRGNDLSETMLGLARKRIKDVKLTQEDAQVLGSYTQGIGTIICCNLIYYLRDPKALDRWKELLAKGGRIIVMEEWPFVYPPRREDGIKFRKYLGRIVRPVSPKRIEGIFRFKGFQLVERKVVRMGDKHELNGFVFEKEESNTTRIDEK